MIDPALTGLAAAACTGLGIRGFVLMRSPSAIERRELPAELTERRAKRGPTRQLIDALGARLGPVLLRRMSERQRIAVGRRLDLAGHPGGMNLERYAEVKAAVLGIGLALAVLFALTGALAFSPFIVLVAWLVVDMWLSRTGRHRQERLERDLPDFIDVLSITVRAGTGYRAALRRVADSLTGPANEEVLQTLRQMDLGATRREAFQALRSRNNSPTLDSFVAAQLQAEELGVPLADALASIAEDTRRAAAQNARRRAQRASPRIALIGATILLPATMILIAGGMFIGSGINFSHVL